MSRTLLSTRKTARILLMLSAATIAAAANGPAAAKAVRHFGCANQFNEWDIPSLDPQTNTFGPTALQIIFAGNVTGQIPAQVTADAAINPFYAYQTLGGPPAHPTTVVYDSGLNQTIVTLSGGPLPVPPPINFPHAYPPPGGAGSGYHTGVNDGFQPDPPVILKRWVWQRTRRAVKQTQDIPFADISWNGTIDANNFSSVLQAVFYYETQSTDHQPTGTWHRPCYVPVKGLATTFTITNDAADTSALRMARAGVESGLPKPDDKKCAKNARCAGNQKNLDELNYQLFPPPGDDGSRFTTLDGLDGVTLAPGESVKVQLP